MEREDRRVSLKQFELQCNLSHCSVCDIIHECIGCLTVRSRWMPEQVSPTPESRQNGHLTDQPPALLVHGVTSNKILILKLYLPPRETRFPNGITVYVMDCKPMRFAFTGPDCMSVRGKTRKPARLICWYIHAEGVISGLIEICIT
jgi:hypothetical protein